MLLARRGRVALADLARGAVQRGGLDRPCALGRHRVVVVGAARVAAADHPGRPDGDHRAGRPGRSCGGSGRGATRVAAAPTCGCGSPRGSPPRRGPTTWPALRGCPTTRGRWGPRSAGTSTCTRCRRSRDCSPSARGAPSSPRSTSPATGSTATCCTSGGSGSTRAPAWAPAASSARAPGSGRAPRCPRARPCCGRCPPARSGRGPRRCSSAPRATSGPTGALRGARDGWRCTA